ncbi:MAG TPA: pentapeptide repeat-containing protein [Dinghuibacter sp.]|uniref:pentapeptide repeat-containing protein n=1 Tax=Dinghuibacter sp. TaxID=2024697 RepID=UPI002BE36F14|nr:pentapeptide repeat-containing protein [Dinghuibacter sp.]HTJ11316.1 pentapeptide repeat-containing protein [Dinghuibacter sp.]
MEEFYEQSFDRLTALSLGEYEDCRFNHCDFSGASLAGSRFINCRFTDCNLSLAGLANTSLQEVHFKGCKMLGLRFDTCSAFGMSLSFTDCVLDNSSFYKIKNHFFYAGQSRLREVDFTDADLTGAIFDDCDLRDAHFENTLLEKADLRTATHYTIDPTRNRVKKARFSWPGVAGLLTAFDIELSA